MFFESDARHSPAYRFLRWLNSGKIRRWESSLRDPEETQKRRFKLLLRLASGSAFASEHQLGAGDSLERLRQRVPVRSHEELLPWLSRAHSGESGVLTREPLLQLLKTSGTSGEPKLLPVTESWAAGVAEAQSLWSLSLLRDHPGLAEGSVLALTSPDLDGVLPSGVPYGSNTGRMASRQSWLLRRRYPAPDPVRQIPQSDLRLYCLLRFALERPLRAMVTANPSTLLRVARALLAWREELAEDRMLGQLRCGPAAQLSPGLRARLERGLSAGDPPSDWRPAKLWPLEVLSCWRGGAAPYFLELLPEAMGAELPVREVGISASESHFTVPVDDAPDGGVAWLGGDLLEFIDSRGQARWAWELTEGERYDLVVTTLSGLWRYDMGDQVQVTGWAGAAPRLRFLRRRADLLNCMGEKISEQQITAAVYACFGRRLMGYTGSLSMGERPRVRIAVERRQADPGAEVRSVALDEALQQENPEYASRREDGRMAPLEIVSLPEGSYDQLRLLRLDQGASSAQVKELLLARSPEAWDLLLQAADRANRSSVT